MLKNSKKESKKLIFSGEKIRTKPGTTLIETTLTEKSLYLDITLAMALNSCGTWHDS